MKELYLFKSFEELTREANKRVRKHKASNLYAAAEKLFITGLQYMDCGDEEMTFILFHRFKLIFYYLESSDPSFKKQRLIGEFNTADGLLVDVGHSLQERYKLLNEKLCHSRAQLIIETPNPPSKKEEQKDDQQKDQKEDQKEDAITFPSGFISSRDLYNLMMNKVDVLMFDARPQKDYMASKMKHPNCINVPEELIETGLSANLLGKKLPAESKAIWDSRWKCKIIVFYDWSSTSSNFMESKIAILKQILLNWDISKSEDVQILILNEGYLSWLQTYPMMCVNPDVIYEVQNNSLDELLNLETVEYPLARVLKPPSLQPSVNRATKPSSPATHSATSSQPTQSTVVTDKSIDTIISDTSNLILDVTTPKPESDKQIDGSLDILDQKDNRSGENTPSDEQKIVDPVAAETILGSRENGLDDSSNQNDYPLRLLQEARELKKPLTKAVPKVNRAIKPSTRPLVVQRGFTGLKNLGATCYMNAVLQVMLNTPKLYDYFMDDSLNANDLTGVAKHFRKFFLNMWSGTFKCMAPKDLRNAFTARERRFIGSDHHDAQEFFYSLNTVVHEDLRMDIDRPVQPAWTPKEQCFIRDTSGQISVITDTFVGQYMVHKQCDSCLYTSINYENFQTVGLTLPHTGQNNLKDCIAFSERRSRIPSSVCSNCNKDSPRVMAHKLHSIPPVIAFTALRFMLESGEYTKNESLFSFPLDSLEFPPNDIYEVYGIVIHRGNMNFGHYIALVKNYLTGRWMRCDDDHVTEIDVKDVLKATDAYMLFYKERENKSKSKNK